MSLLTKGQKFYNNSLLITRSRHFIKNLTNSYKITKHIKLIETSLTLNLFHYKRVITASNLCCLQLAARAHASPLHSIVVAKYYSSKVDDGTSYKDPKVKESIESNLPSQKQLENVEKLMKIQIGDFFVSRHEYRIYTKDVEFENKWNPSKPQTTKGLFRYALKVMKARFYVHTYFPKVRVTILDSILNPSQGSVKVKWRVDALQQSKMFAIRSITPANMRKTADSMAKHFEMISTFYVNVRGFIYKHKLERIIPEDLKPKD